MSKIAKWIASGVIGGSRILGPELITNGNMETGSPPANWSAGADTPTLSSAADQRTGGTGTKSLDIAIAVGQAAGTVLQTGITTEVGATYRFSAWGKNVDADHYTLVVYTNSYGATPVLHEEDAASWMNYTADFISAEAGVHVVLLAVGAAGQHARIDDVSLRKVLHP